MLQKTQSIIEKTLEFLVNKGVMFTAFDVTKAVRKLGENVLHKDVKTFIVTSEQTILKNYNKTLTNIGNLVFGDPTVNVKANIYHPVNSDINSYNPLDLSDTNTINNKSNSDSKSNLKFDKRKRFQVNSSILNKAGIVPFEKLSYSYSEPNCLIIKEFDHNETNKNMLAGETILTVTSSNRNRIYIYESTFKRFFGKIPNNIRFEPHDKLVKIYEEN